MTKTLHKMSMRQLRLVSTLGRELNLSRTAKLLHTTQPALSRSLAQLESLLEVRLFNRTTARMSLTPAGTTLMQHANRVLAELELAEADLLGLQVGVRGEVRVGMLPTFSSNLLGCALGRAQAALPGVAFSVELLRVQELYEALQAGRIDLMLSHAEFELSLNALEVVELYLERNAVLVAEGHPLARQSVVTHAQLARHGWVLPSPETPLRRQVGRLLAIHRGRTLRVADVQTDSLLVAQALVRHAGLIWAIAERVAEPLCAAGGLRALAVSEGPLAAGPMCAFHVRGRALTPAARVLLDCIRDLASADAP